MLIAARADTQTSWERAYPCLTGWEAVHREVLPLQTHYNATKRVGGGLFTGRSHTGRPLLTSWGKQESHWPGGARQMTREAASSGLWSSHACIVDVGSWKSFCADLVLGNQAVGVWGNGTAWAWWEEHPLARETHLSSVPLKSSRDRDQHQPDCKRDISRAPAHDPKASSEEWIWSWGSIYW